MPATMLNTKRRSRGSHEWVEKTLAEREPQMNRAAWRDACPIRTESIGGRGPSRINPAHPAPERIERAGTGSDRNRQRSYRSSDRPQVVVVSLALTQAQLRASHALGR